MKRAELGCPTRGLQLCVLGILLSSPVWAQGERFEVTPVAGGMLGGIWRLEQQGVPNFDAHLGNGLSFGISGGVRFSGEEDDGSLCEYCNAIAFRWVRQNTHLGLELDPLVATPVAAPSFHPNVTLDYFLVDFSHEWTIQESRMVHPFLIGSLGVARTGTEPAESSVIRFVFGIGAGVKVFPSRHWGFRLQAEYLPIVMWAGLQRVVCTTGCVVALDGGIMNHFQFSAGPSFRF